MLALQADRPHSPRGKWKVFLSSVLRKDRGGGKRIVSSSICIKVEKFHQIPGEIPFQAGLRMGNKP